MTTVTGDDERHDNQLTLKEDLEDTSSLLVDETRDSLDTTSSGESSDGGLGDTLDVVSKDLSVSLGSSLAQSFSTWCEDEVK